MTELKVAVLGVGVMGADHVARITSQIAGARVAVVNDYITEKAEQIAAQIDGCRAVTDPLDAIAAADVDAVVLATPGTTHEKQLLACLEHRKPVLCEKPLTTDVSTSLEIVRREAELGVSLIQVGFMRRFDEEYMRLKALLDGGELGQPLVMHCVHRNANVPSYFDSTLIVKDSFVHEVDVTRFLFDEEIASVQMIKPASNPGAPEGVADPQIAIMRTESGKHVDVELFVTTGVGYEVRTAHDGPSAIAALDSGAIDLLLTDVVLSGPINGAELGRQARAKHPELAVVFMSGYTENAIIHNGRLDADVTLLEKPFSLRQLALTMRDVLTDRD